MLHIRSNNNQLKYLNEFSLDLFIMTVISWRASSKDGTVSIHQRNIQTHALEMFKCLNLQKLLDPFTLRINERLCAIYYYLYNLKNVKKYPWRSFSFSNVTKVTTVLKITLLRRCFSRFLYKWYQIAQNITIITTW